MAKAWANSGLDLHLDGVVSGRKVRERLEHALRDAVIAGQLVPGATLPPSRTLSRDLGVARNTVAEAYSQLVAEGWFVARQGSATRVATRARPDRPTTTSGIDAQHEVPRYDLRAGFPDVSGFPRAQWLAASRAALAQAGHDAFGYGYPSGQPQLRAVLREYVGRARGVRCQPDALLVCAGFSAGLRLVAEALYARGARRIGVERYGHARHRGLLVAAGLRPVPLPVDEHGAVPDGLDRLDAVVLTPAHQFPLGVALSAQRRAQFTSWAARSGAVIVEDDYDGEFRFDRRALGAVQALSPDHVVYAGTASKTLAPGLRLGWLVAPPQLRAAIAELQADAHAQAAVVEQLTLAEFVRSGRYDRHIRRSRLRYRRRRHDLIDGLTRHAPWLRPIGTSAGLHLTAVLPDSADAASELVARAASQDLALESLAAYDSLDGTHDSDTSAGTTTLVLGYATPPQHVYASALDRLYATLQAPRASESRWAQVRTDSVSDSVSGGGRRAGTSAVATASVPATTTRARKIVR